MAIFQSYISSLEIIAISLTNMYSGSNPTAKEIVNEVAGILMNQPTNQPTNKHTIMSYKESCLTYIYVCTYGTYINIVVLYYICVYFNMICGLCIYI